MNRDVSAGRRTRLLAIRRRNPVCNSKGQYLSIKKRIFLDKRFRKKRISCHYRREGRAGLYFARRDACKYQLLLGNWLEGNERLPAKADPLPHRAAVCETPGRWFRRRFYEPSEMKASPIQHRDLNHFLTCLNWMVFKQ